MSADATRPLVSIIVPVYNGERYLMEALESCFAQTYRNLEIIVVDDCATDASASIAETAAAADPRLRVIRRPVNGGIARAFNTGFQAAKGSYLTRLAQDDAFYPQAVECMVDALECDPSCDLAYGDMDQIDEQGRVLFQIITNPPDSAVLPRNRLGLCVLWTRRLMDATGWFDPKMELAEDYDYWLRASLEFKFCKVQAAPLFRFRIHSGQASVAKAAKLSAAIIRVHILYRWRLVKLAPFSLSRWIKMFRSQARLALFFCRHGWVKNSR